MQRTDTKDGQAQCGRDTKMPGVIAMCTRGLSPLCPLEVNSAVHTIHHSIVSDSQSDSPGNDNTLEPPPGTVFSPGILLLPVKTGQSWRP